MKPGTFTQLHVQIVFAVKYRECLLNKEKRDKLFPYISGIITNIGHKSLIVNGFSDHVHIFLGLNPNITISETVSQIKKASSSYINEKKWFLGKFTWQNGYGAFSYSNSHVKNVYNYIANQEKHHKSNSFKEEYLKVLQKSEINFDERYLFEYFDNVDV